MHGVKKEKDAEKILQKKIEDKKRIEEFCSHLKSAEEDRKEAKDVESAWKALKSSASVLELNSGHYTMWNMRKEALEIITFKERSTLENELKLTTRCLQTNPKAYCIWEHRRWCIEETNFEGIIAAEIALCEKFHSYDSRNFHCWNYRRWLMERDESISTEKKQEIELSYTLKKIQDDFSNYSAWHARSVVFDGDFKREWKMIFNGIYTNPNDQSLWMYVYWLLSKNEDFQHVYELASHCCELFQLDGVKESKWTMLTMVHLLQKHRLAALCEEHGKELPRMKGEKEMGALELIDALVEIDPYRSRYYEDLKK